MLGEFYDMQVGDFLRCLRVACICQFPIRKCLISIDFRFERNDGKRLSTIASVMRKIWILWSRWRRRGARTEQSMSKIYALQVSRKMMFYSIDLVLVTIFLRVLEGSVSKINITIPKIVSFKVGLGGGSWGFNPCTQPQQPYGSHNIINIFMFVLAKRRVESQLV